MYFNSRPYRYDAARPFIQARQTKNKALLLFKKKKIGLITNWLSFLYPICGISINQHNLGNKLAPQKLVFSTNIGQHIRPRVG